ncbi:putative peptidoglycan endopeptidase LytE precursor [Clostridium tepidiprofundi DSM 19306]|uniref:Putative peptidoglycan endopeptidase LytE n=1 Tax=Clostridium tepidiprofundi DSM 19306 TaxID=1121338 RepID=A0A151B2Y1_9CLOT|nr:LysM peptidoglycan-binding domain-containing protein [Clostridium tepidiprofundi]KYH34265.1 putative peptidoglycan endopeptidase LytE precursor [Clostridium tepidiprofundi DSM 19306]
MNTINDIVENRNKNLDIDIYTVKEGDTLLSISQKYGITVDELKRLNNLSSDIIYLNQILRVI